MLVNQRIKYTYIAIAALVGLLISLIPCFSTHAQTDTLSRLATILGRRAKDTINVETTTIASMELASLIIEEALRLNPNNPDLHRAALALARMSENQELRKKLVADLVQLAPDDEFIRLERLNDALERYQNADELTQAYRVLLSEKNISRVGPGVASRLAMDFALLHRRAGNEAELGKWLGRATAIDQSNKVAASMAAGYFHLYESDPFAQAELLVNLVLADPSDRYSHAALARHLLQYGAYEGAARFYQLSSELHQPLDELPTHNLLADLALAQWAAGNYDKARKTMRERKQLLDRIDQGLAWQDNPDLPLKDRLEIKAKVPPTLAAVNIAMLDRSGSDEALIALKGFDELLKSLMENSDQEVTDEQKFDTLLTRAWLGIWFGNNPDAIEELIDQAEKLHLLTDIAKARFDGWIAFKRGDLTAAEDLLIQHAEKDPASLLGLGLVQLESGDSKSGVAALLEVWKKEPGTLMGVWSRDYAASLLDNRFPNDDLAEKLDDLVAGFPSMLNNVAENTSRVLSLRIESLKTRLGPYESIPIRLTISNNSSIPLGISHNGPVAPLVLIEPRMTIAHRPRIRGTRTIVLDIARKLRIEPFSQLVIDFDLRDYDPGDVLNAVVLHGCNMTLKATLNQHYTDNNTIKPGPLGSSIISTIIRVNGVRVDDEWIEDAIGAIKTPDTRNDINRMAILAEVISGRSTTLDAELQTIADEAATVLTESYTKLAPLDQAWLLSVMSPTGDALEPIRRIARASEDYQIQIAYLLNQSRGSDDPMLLAAIRSDNPKLRQLGTLLQTVVEQQEKLKLIQN